jgi:hypothetical protein
VKNAHWETWLRASKWAQALHFWWIINLSSLDQAKEKKKIAV